MTQTDKTAREFIQHSFSPLVAVIRSSEVDHIVGRNNLSFVDLLQPFCNLSSEGQVRDPSGTQCTVKNWRLVIRDVHWKPPPPVEARKLLNHAVTSNQCLNTVTLDVGRYKIDIPSSTPWIDSWRDKYVDVQFASEHEFTKHFVSCMLVASTLDVDVADTFKNLVQMTAQLQTVTPPRLPRWFNSNVLRSYVLVHDNSTGRRDKAERAFEAIKQTYGAGNCFFLCINSRTASEPDCDHVLTDPWKKLITRRYDANTDFSSQGSLPRTPVDSRTISNIADQSEEHRMYASSVQPEPPHPLSPVEEQEITFDNANTLQNTLSGSTESVVSNMNTSMWEPTATVVHGACLTKQDIDAIKQFINDFAFKALLPYFERQISALHEAVANRKGMSRSLLSATKRWFGTNKPGTNTNVNSVIYTPECPELQLRRLGDLWFMCGQWGRAFDAYHTAKREFNADGAWLCYAGALEMAALSAFMADEPTKKTYMYMEEAITTYLNTCRMAPYAVRATLLSVQCLTSRGLYGEAAKQLIRMTCEESDLRSAVLLEWAAVCFVTDGPARRTLPPMPRKYAFHIVLAGNRYSKAGQKQHAYRCYKQAYQVYEGSGWRLSVDNVQFSVGRLAGALRRPDEAVRWLAAPLAPGPARPPAHHHTLLREYALAHQQWIESSEELKKAVPVLPLPLLLSQATRVCCGGIPPLASPGRAPASGTSLADADAPDHTDQHKYWHKMEEMILQEVGSPPMIFKPTVTLFTNETDNSANPTVPQGEPVHISFQLENPLGISLTLTEVELLWRFECEGEIFSNEEGSEGRGELVAGRGLGVLSLAPQAVHTVALSLTPLRAGMLAVVGVGYKLCNSIEGSEDSGVGTVISGKQVFDIRGPRLRRNKDTTSPEYGVDRRLHIVVTASAPCLQMTFSEISGRVVSGELLSVDVDTLNAGPAELRNLHVCVSHPQCMRLVSAERAEFAHLLAVKYTEVPPNLEERVVRSLRWREACARHVTRLPLPSPAPPARFTLLLRPARAHPALRLLAYYEAPPAPGVKTPQYRLLRHTFKLDVMESAKIVAIPRRNIKLSGEEKSASETLTLAVEVQNINGKLREEGSLQLEVIEASLISQQWRLTDLVASQTALEPLAPHEKLHLVLRGRRNVTTENSPPLIHSGVKIKPNVPESAASIADRPYSEFVVDFHSPWDDDFDARGQGKIKKLGAFIESMLVVRWKARVDSLERPVIGQHYLWLDCFTSKISSQVEPESAGVPLQVFGREEPPKIPEADRQMQHAVIYRLEHSEKVDHNFAKRKLCLVPVVLHIVNCHSAPVTSYVDWSGAGAGDSGVGWTGAVRGGGAGAGGGAGGVRVSLAGFESRRVRACAAVTAPGTYQLGDALRVSCGPLPARAPPSLLTVTNAG